MSNHVWILVGITTASDGYICKKCDAYCETHPNKKPLVNGCIESNERKRRMTTKTLKALKTTIERWERNTQLESFSLFAPGRKECALCTLFWGSGCAGCPVKLKTGESNCINTPYQKIITAYDKKCLPQGFAPDNWRELIKAELDFLISLLPEEDLNKNPQN